MGLMVRDLLTELDLGNSVAEFDEALEKYFVETETFRKLIRGEVDIVAGDKGTGKTALFRILAQRYRSLPDLQEVEVVAGFNLSGNPVFQRLAEGEVLEEGQYLTIWKAYVLSLVGNWLLGIYQDAWTDKMYELNTLLSSVGLRSAEDSPSTIFSQIVNLVRRLLDPRAVEVTMSLTPSGLPLVGTRIELGDGRDAQETEVPHTHALGLLDAILGEVEIEAWVVLDRLDEAFAGFPKAEIPALRALLRAYLDLSEFPNLHLKLFVRRDLFRRIIEGGFVNLTHVNARKVEIVWEEEDLSNLLGRRIAENGHFLAALNLGGSDHEQIFDVVFPGQVDQGSRKPSTWAWMMSRIRDGNDVRPPRNLIDLVRKSVDEQLRREERESNVYTNDEPLVRPDAIKLGLQRLSKERVEDTLLAEAGGHAHLIERFRDGKAEHNRGSLSELLGLQGVDFDRAIEILREIGFLEPVGANFKVPILYRDGLSITQGKAF